MILEIPVANTRNDRVIGEPLYKIDLGDEAISIFYDYKYQVFLDRDHPELGFKEKVERVLEEYVVDREAIKLVSLVRSEDEEVFYVGFDLANIFYDIKINFYALKDAKEFRDAICKWWLGENNDTERG